ncbi:MAG TPA: tRNA pseudouridine(55) synthase TruB [Pyrinomonadaceae bacterium]|nr:tRNA pseudouridine(55) synthase TruB [Chloracidobacterium sp.]MBP9935762.1 tRNA pseudouridine(55) synthase TruB [Pyrinomonadaceae bacterium]MBK7801285.1 tRNA pseudouridine(55) synthase TruB [Chloracidobacterium sp.]MBK9436606.1 tRNA pseudouridine(55) synthase TruB [Chloracidobacterium sp.]MBK9767503.1 tRNA pseudouridine(55) synthase TruB [Chloracidobacterium sp.]
MNGVLIIDKPAGITSHDVVYRVRRILKTKRVGHTGTLDPFATGVMVILVGQATRLAQFLDKDEKEYEALVRFGFETDTGDVTGLKSAESGMTADELAAKLAATDLEKVLALFRGEIDQVPPMYSAKKIDGQKLYELARKGETVERKAVKVTINSLEMIESAADSLRMRVACSAGTYIRTLAEDIGREIGVGAHLTELRRTRAGRFDLTRSITLDDLAKLDEPTAALIPMEEAVGHLSALTLNTDRVSKTRSGLSTRIYEDLFADGATVRMIDEDGQLVAIGNFDAAENSVRPRVVMV